MAVNIPLTESTLALILGLGLVMVFIGLYVRGGILSPFINFVALAWFFVWGTQTAAWSQTIIQFWAVVNVNALAESTIPNQPFILIFPLMVFISLGAMLDGIIAFLYSGNSGTATPKHENPLRGRNPNRGL